MKEGLLQGLYRLVSDRPLREVARDLFDIFVVAFVLYRALLVVRGTRAIQMGLGLGIVFLVYLGAKLLGLVTLLSLLSWLLSAIILIVIVVFQNDIRRALIRMGATARLTAGREQQSKVIDEVVAAATELARHRTGAIIAFEQDANMLEFCKSEGIPIDSVVTRELLVSLFIPEAVNKLHDGAVLIRDLRIARAGVFFPMPDQKILDASLGTRHRASLGITEETDAVVVVVSEERGTISFCFSGNIVSGLDGQSLRHALLGLFGRKSRKKAAPRRTLAPPSPAPAPTSASSGPPSTAAGRAPTSSEPPPARPTVPATSRLAPGSAIAPATITLAPPPPVDSDPGPMAHPAGRPMSPSKLPTSTPMKPAERPEARALLDKNDKSDKGDDRPSGDKGRHSALDLPDMPRSARPSTFVPAPTDAPKKGDDS